MRSGDIKTIKSPNAREIFASENVEQSFYLIGTDIRTYYVNANIQYSYCSGNNTFLSASKSDVKVSVGGAMSVLVGWTDTATPVINLSPQTISYVIQGRTVLGIVAGSVTLGIPKDLTMSGSLGTGIIKTAPDGTSCTGSGQGSGGSGGSGPGSRGDGNGDGDEKGPGWGSGGIGSGGVILPGNGGSSGSGSGSGTGTGSGSGSGTGSGTGSGGSGGGKPPKTPDTPPGQITYIPQYISSNTTYWVS